MPPRSMDLIKLVIFTKTTCWLVIYVTKNGFFPAGKYMQYIQRKRLNSKPHRQKPLILHYEKETIKRWKGRKALIPGGWVQRVKIMKAMDAARAALRASHPGPKMVNAKTPIAAHPICATNMLYFCTHSKTPHPTTSQSPPFPIQKKRIQTLRDRERSGLACAPGEVGVANRTAETAPSGAIVMNSPLGASAWSTFPKIAMAANAPATHKFTSQPTTRKKKKKKKTGNIKSNSDLSTARARR